MRSHEIEFAPEVTETIATAIVQPRLPQLDVFELDRNSHSIRASLATGSQPLDEETEGGHREDEGDYEDDQNYAARLREIHCS